MQKVVESFNLLFGTFSDETQSRLESPEECCLACISFQTQLVGERAWFFHTSLDLWQKKLYKY